MTPSEFKAWFDGFTEAFDKTPTKAQWERVKARVAEIDGKPVTERVYVDRYWPLYQRYYGLQNQPGLYYSQTLAGVGTIGAAGQGQMTGHTTYLNASNNGANQAGHNTTTFDGVTAMAALGRAEATELARA